MRRHRPLIAGKTARRVSRAQSTHTARGLPTAHSVLRRGVPRARITSPLGKRPPATFSQRNASRINVPSATCTGIACPATGRGRATPPSGAMCKRGHARTPTPSWTNPAWCKCVRRQEARRRRRRSAEHVNSATTANAFTSAKRRIRQTTRTARAVGAAPWDSPPRIRIWRPGPVSTSHTCRRATSAAIQATARRGTCARATRTSRSTAAAIRMARGWRHAWRQTRRACRIPYI